MALTWTQWPWYLNRTQILSWCTTIPKWAFYVNYFKRYRQTDTHTHIHTLRKHYNATVRWTPINFLYLLFIKSSIFKNKKYFFKFQNCRVGLEPNACYNNERIVSTGEMLLTRKNNFQQTLKKICWFSCKCHYINQCYAGHTFVCHIFDTVQDRNRVTAQVLAIARIFEQWTLTFFTKG